MPPSGFVVQAHNGCLGMGVSSQDKQWLDHKISLQTQWAFFIEFS